MISSQLPRMCLIFIPVGFQSVISNAVQGSKSQDWKYVENLTFAENRNVSESLAVSKWSDQNGLMKTYSGPANVRPSVRFSKALTLKLILKLVINMFCIGRHTR